METDVLELEVALADRGNALSVNGDGDMTLRLAVSPQYRAQVLALVDLLAEGRTVRLVVVRP
jgi:hypothetical protein